MADNDAIVIGSGSGGYGCAIRFARLDSRPRAQTAAEHWAASAVEAFPDMTSYLSSQANFSIAEQKQHLILLFTAGPPAKTNGEAHG
jgi:thioredoxin reductase